MATRDGQGTRLFMSFFHKGVVSSAWGLVGGGAKEGAVGGHNGPVDRREPARREAGWGDNAGACCVAFPLAI